MRPLRVEHPPGLEVGDLRDQLDLPAREVMKELALARLRAGADVVQRRARHAPLEDQIGRGLDDPRPRRCPFLRQHSIEDSGPASPVWYVFGPWSPNSQARPRWSPAQPATSAGRSRSRSAPP